MTPKPPNINVMVHLPAKYAQDEIKVSWGKLDVLRGVTFESIGDAAQKLVFLDPAKKGAPAAKIIGKYSLALSMGNTEVPVPDFLRVVTLNPPVENEDLSQVLQWYGEEHLPRICEVRGVNFGQVFDCLNPDLTQHRYLAMYGLASPEVPDSAEWIAATLGSEKGFDLIHTLKDLSRGTYRRIVL